ncbi:hypothetical protein [Nocardia sp. Marseille-Q1738]
MTSHELIAEGLRVQVRRLIRERDESRKNYRDLHVRCEELVGERDDARHALEAKTEQHAETLSRLEHAYEVIERDSRPPLAYVVVKKGPDVRRHVEEDAYYVVSNASSSRQECERIRDVEAQHSRPEFELFVGEIREASDDRA